MFRLLSNRKKKNQTMLVKSVLMSGKTMTQREAAYMHGIFRLAARIYELRHKHGMTIHTDRSNGYAIYKAVL